MTHEDVIFIAENHVVVMINIASPEGSEKILYEVCIDGQNYEIDFLYKTLPRFSISGDLLLIYNDFTYYVFYLKLKKFTRNDEREELRSIFIFRDYFIIVYECGVARKIIDSGLINAKYEHNDVIVESHIYENKLFIIDWNGEEYVLNYEDDVQFLPEKV